MVFLEINSWDGPPLFRGEPCMCFELSDDCIDELAMGRLRGTKEQRHLDECGECQERVRRCREWITMLRQVLGENRRAAGPRND